MTLEFTQLLTEMSTRNFREGGLKPRSALKADNLTICDLIV
jgi:hypothetical protein